MKAARLRVRAALRSLRANARFLLGRILARLMGPRGRVAELDPRNISRILVVRINARMGNTAFLTPMLIRLHELLPHACFDLAVSYPQAERLLAGFPGLRHVITFPHKGLSLVGRYFAALRRLRAQRYDLVIDPVPESTSGRIALALSRGRYRLGFASDSQWAPLTHSVPPLRELTHQAVQPVYLVSRAFGTAFERQGLQLSLALRAEELKSGRIAVARAIQQTALPPGTGAVDETLCAPAARVFGFFAHATAGKVVGQPWWRQFWEHFLELQPEAVPLEFLPSPDTPPTDPRFATAHFPSPRDLAAATAATRLFISADTGPMHLASSTSVPTVALFQASDPALYGPLKSCDVAIDISHITPRDVAERCQRLWRNTERTEEGRALRQR